MKTKITAALILAGFYFLMGAAGAVDYATEVGAYMPMDALLKGSLLGIGCLLTALAISRRSE